MVGHLATDCACLAFAVMVVACVGVDRSSTSNQKFAASAGPGYCQPVALDASSDYVLRDPDSGVSVAIPRGSFISDGGTVEVCINAYNTEEQMPGYSPDTGVLGRVGSATEQIITCGAATISANADLAPGAVLTITLPVPVGRECLMRYALDLRIVGVWTFQAGVWTQIVDADVSYSASGTVLRISALGSINCDIIKRLLSNLSSCGDAGTDGSARGDAGADAS